LPEAVLAKEFTGHTGTVWTLDISPDGTTIASGGDDAVIRLWNTSTGQIEKTLQGHQRTVWDVKFSPDGKILASGSFDKTLRIWNVEDGKQIQILTHHTQAVVALAFSHDGKKLVSTSDDKTIRVWNTDDWSLVFTAEVPEHNQAADFSPDDKLLLTGGRDKTTLGEFLQNFFGDAEYNKGVSMRLWDAQTGQLLQTFSEHSNDVNDVAFSRMENGSLVQVQIRR
jgi:WD40 repeat protein